MNGVGTFIVVTEDRPTLQRFAEEVIPALRSAAADERGTPVSLRYELTAHCPRCRRSSPSDNAPALPWRCCYKAVRALGLRSRRGGRSRPVRCMRNPGNWRHATTYPPVPFTGHFPPVQIAQIRNYGPVDDGCYRSAT